MIIYFDMDGVLTNFRKRIEEYKAEGKQTDYEFWVSLEELLDRNVVLSLAKVFNVGIVSALPSKPYHSENATLGKRKWLENHYKGIFNPIHIISSSKGKCCVPGDILIDNKQSNLDAWTEAGGIGIYFDGYTESSKDLIGRLIPILSMA
jgi:5'(3')-deoxyribonucleotidase